MSPSYQRHTPVILLHQSSAGNRAGQNRMCVQYAGHPANLSLVSVTQLKSGQLAATTCITELYSDAVHVAIVFELELKHTMDLMTN